MNGVRSEQLKIVDSGDKIIDADIKEFFRTIKAPKSYRTNEF